MGIRKKRRERMLGTEKPSGLKLPTVTWSDVVKNVTTSNENVPIPDGNTGMSHGIGKKDGKTETDEKTDTDEKRSE
jgi:hypothetical protein